MNFKTYNFWEINRIILLLQKLKKYYVSQN